MKIETQLTFNNIRKNIKRTIYTTISIALCSFLIIATLLVATSISSSFKENIAQKYNDYYFLIKNINLDRLNKIKTKEYIAQIYLQENNEGQLYEIDNLPDSFQITDGINIYIKYDNYKKTCAYTNDILETLNLTYVETSENCELNTKLLNSYGLIDVSIIPNGYADSVPTCQARLNFTYVADILLVIILLIFSILSIIILYNAFLITINERKKDYAVLNSIGATEGQILKMTFLENIIIGIIGIIIGFLLSYLCSDLLLKLLNNIVASTIYNFKLVVDIKYIIISFVIIIINIYISSLIPSIRASSASVIQGIKNNKQIKSQTNNSIFEKHLNIEGKLALKNLKRNKNKYKIITILLVICMTSYITISTYINYEKVAANLIDEYDVDAELELNENSNKYYKTILDNYSTTSVDKIEYLEYKVMGLYALVKPEDALIANCRYADAQHFPIRIIGLDDKSYTNYITDLNANNEDYIIYNNITQKEGKTEYVYKYYTAFETNYDFNFKIVYCNYVDEEASYEIIDDETLKENFVLTEKLPSGFKEINNTEKITIFTNMDTFNKIEEKINIHPKGVNQQNIWMHFGNTSNSGNFVKIKCGNIINFSNYMDNIIQNQNTDISAKYYSLENQEKIIYANVLELILQTIILTIIIIGIISSINIINASLCEREEEFKALSRLGATKENIIKILIYENIYMFIKATIISIVLSIPILYAIIKSMTKTIILDKILIPFTSIGIFILLLFIISLIIAIYSVKFIKEE